MLYGYMYLKNAWRIILANDINLNTDLEALKNRVQEYIFHLNQNRQTIGTTPTTLVKFYPQIVAHTHMVVGFLLNINLVSTQEIKIQLKFNGGIVYELVQTLEMGWRTVSFPYILPSIGAGSHIIEIIAFVDSEQVTIEPGKLNVFLEGQSLLGASSLPPSINIMEEVVMFSINNETINVISNVELQTNVEAAGTADIGYEQVNNNKVTTSVTIELL